MNIKILEKAEKLVKPEYEKLKCWAHAWPHISRVNDNAKKLARIVEEDPIICGIAAYCHDLGRVIEQETRGKQTELGKIDHYLDSIEPTVEVLKKLRIKGHDFNSIVEAVSVHSNKLYYGHNKIAKVLRDSDKKDSFGPWGTLRCIKHHFNSDFVKTEEIMENINNPEKIKELADKTVEAIKNIDVIREKYLGVLKFVLEWVDDKMLDLKESYSFLESDYLYTKQSRDFLLS